MDEALLEVFDISGPMSLSQVTSRTGLTQDTLRYYEKIGLLPKIERDKSSNQRKYSTHNVFDAFLVAALRASGMSIQDMRTYLANEKSQQGTIKKRMELLVKQQAVVKNEIRTLNKQLEFMQKKVDHYKALSAGDHERRRRIEIELIELSKTLNHGNKLDKQDE
jgi:DNA-binding transcriptional MerR regulator